MRPFPGIPFPGEFASSILPTSCLSILWGEVAGPEVRCHDSRNGLHGPRSSAGQSSALARVVGVLKNAWNRAIRAYRHKRSKRLSSAGLIAGQMRQQEWWGGYVTIGCSPIAAKVCKIAKPSGASLPFMHSAMQPP